ncbi:alpha/beta-Hydrolases superfamily protein [Actinidia rufa]|uniref:Alpha/beta-Hydrolases superfamily protein n=1 Tax=Actinidia rufa TaxID=165716 RepID=A0A7J0GDW0_9ERIC|nr:alpha/beta-Hydrolases superfamily protein [Actinidia rufa]
MTVEPIPDEYVSKANLMVLALKKMSHLLHTIQASLPNALYCVGDTLPSVESPPIPRGSANLQVSLPYRCTPSTPPSSSTLWNHITSRNFQPMLVLVYWSDLTELITWTCSRCDDLTEGFEMIELVVDVEHCLQGFVGIAKDLNAIVIAFRGTQGNSIMNWIEDLYWKQVDLDYPGMPDAMVHHGFYCAYHETTVRSGILHAVKRAKELYGDINIMVTGHSMGGAMAAFCALDLAVNQKIQNVQVMTFGQPRIGNTAFASYYSQLVPNTIRVTNDHDIVPHLPPYYPYLTQKTYRHFPREVWLYDDGAGTLVYPVEKVCDDSGEDPICSRSVVGDSITDHLEYYGVELGSEVPGTCRIVMDPRMADYSTQDLAGNFVLYRDPSASIVKMKTEPSTPSNSI